MADSIPTTPANGPPPAPVAGGALPQSAPTAPPSPPASQTSLAFGGFRGGRPRKDGLRPGSPAALAADREKERKRKELQRERERLRADPPPLPSAAPGVARTPAAAADPVDPLLLAEAAPPVAWEASQLTPIFQQLLPAVEQLTVNQVLQRAGKARLPGELLHEIEDEAKWSAPTKKALELSGPQVAAKWLNKTGISAENQPEVVFGTAVASLLASHVMLLRRLDKLIAAANVPTVKPDEEKNGGRR